MIGVVSRGMRSEPLKDVEMSLPSRLFDRGPADERLIFILVVNVVRYAEPAIRCWRVRVGDNGHTVRQRSQDGAVAIIDERKANRICSERFPALGVISTVDLFAQPAVLEALGRDKLAQAILNALQLARMRVLAHRVDWVVQLIGLRQAALCPSLPRAVRHTKGSL